jgi:plastocyanin
MATGTAVCLLVVIGCGSSHSSGTGSSATAKTSGSRSTLHINGTPKFATAPPGTPVRSGQVPVAYRNITINPDVLRVKAGTTIRWTNFDPIQHNVTSISGPSKFASKNLGEGASYEVKLTKPGVIHYECTIHPTTMNGTIEVVR